MSAEAVVRKQLDAYNAKDIEAFMSCWARDAEVFAHPDIPLASGRADIRARHVLRFQEPDLHALIERNGMTPNLLSFNVPCPTVLHPSSTQMFCRMCFPQDPVCNVEHLQSIYMSPTLIFALQHPLGALLGTFFFIPLHFILRIADLSSLVSLAARKLTVTPRH